MNDALRIRIAHYRYSATNPGFLGRYRRGLGARENAFRPAVKGGETYARLVDKETGKVLLEAVAKCSLEDNFCYKTGRELALMRLRALMKKMQEDAHGMD